MNNHFPQNLSILRRRAGYTQETLAEALGVSRQAVGKWESGQALPEAATLLTLADLLGCSLDDLMRSPLTEDGEVDALAAEREQEEIDLAVYDAYHAHVGVFARSIALGVFLVLAGVAVTALAAAMGFAEVVEIAIFFLFLIAAVFIFVTTGMADEDFKKNNPEILPLFDQSEKLAFQRTSRVVVALCVVGILADVALCGIFASMVASERIGIYIGAFFLGALALCVAPLVYMGCLSARYEPREMSERRRKNDLSGPIMLLATACFLIWGLVWDGWKVSWVCFIIGAALCALAEALQKRD